MNPLTKSLYRVLIRKARILDRHHPLKALVTPFNDDTSTLIEDACNFYSLRYECDLHESSHSIQQHIRITFDFLRTLHVHPNQISIRSLSNEYLHPHYLSQCGFDAIKTLSTALELSEFLEYDMQSVESLPESKYVPIRESTPIQQALSIAESGGNDEEIHRINSACMFIKLGNASTTVQERIGYYIKSINSFETADAFTFLGWTVYSHCVRRKETESESPSNSDDSNDQKMSPLINILETNSDREIADQLKQEILNAVNTDKDGDVLNADTTQSAQALLSLDARDAMFLCMKCDRVAAVLDPEFGNSWNDLGICVMNQLFISDQSEEALALFEKAKQCPRYSCREFAFVNAARLYLRHKKDMVKAIRNYLGALYFNRNESEALKVIQEYRPSLLAAMQRGQSSV